MPINVFGSTSESTKNTIDTSSFVRKTYLRTVYNASIIEGNKNVKNCVKITNLAEPISIIEAASKFYVDNKFKDPSITKNSAPVDLTDKKLKNVRFVKVESMPVVGEHLTKNIILIKLICSSVGESSLLILDPDEKLKLDEQPFIILKSTLTSPKAMTEITTASYFDNLSEKDGNSRDMTFVFNDQDNEFDNNNWTKLDKFTVNRNPTLDNELSKGNMLMTQ